MLCKREDQPGDLHRRPRQHRESVPSRSRPVHRDHVCRKPRSIPHGRGGFRRIGTPPETHAIGMSSKAIRNSLKWHGIFPTPYRHLSMFECARLRTAPSPRSRFRYGFRSMTRSVFRRAGRSARHAGMALPLASSRPLTNTGNRRAAHGLSRTQQHHLPSLSRRCEQRQLNFSFAADKDHDASKLAKDQR